MNLYIVRHGNPDYCRDCLTELGHRQAEACAEDMLPLEIDDIYSSPYGRAKETAAHLADKLGKKIEILPWAHEVEHYSDDGHGGVTMGVMMDPALLRSPEMEALGDRWASHPAFRDEASARKMVDEVYNGMRELLAGYGYFEEGHRFRTENGGSDKNIALYCHAGTFLIIAEYVLRMPTMFGWSSFFTWQTGISWVNFNTSAGGYCVPRFYTMGKTDHLSKRGIEIT